MKTKHDLGLLKQDGTTKVGLMIVKDKNGVPLYREFDDEYLAEQRLTGVPGYGALPPEKELAIRQDDWRSGFGLEVYDADDPKRYFASYNTDLRFRGMAICGPKATAVTKPTAPAAPTIANADMEAVGSWTNGARSAVRFHGGANSWLVGAVIAFQDMAGFATYQNLEVTFTCWVWVNLANKARININDGVGSTNSSWHTGGSTWELLSVVRTLNNAATQFRLELEDAGANSYFDDAAVTVSALTLGTTVAFADFNDKLYASFGKILGKMNVG